MPKKSEAVFSNILKFILGEWSVNHSIRTVNMIM